jgi:ribosomal protein S18 acetylase RimI-like enzyme
VTIKAVCSLRTADLEDVPFLLELRKATMAAYLAQFGRDLSEEQNLSRVLYRFECAQIVLNDEKPVGLFKVHRGEGLWEIIQLQLCPSMQGRGIGSELLRRLILEAEAAKAQLQLSVLRNNPARRLYESLGFTVIGSDASEYFMRLATSKSKGFIDE